MASSNVFDLIVGASDWVTVDFINNLDRLINNEEVTAVDWDVEDPTVATYVNLSSAVDADGRYGSAQFTAVADGVTRVLVTATTTNPVATPIVYIFLRVYTPPSSVADGYSDDY